MLKEGPNKLSRAQWCRKEVRPVALKGATDHSMSHGTYFDVHTPRKKYCLLESNRAMKEGREKPSEMLVKLEMGNVLKSVRYLKEN